MSDIKTITQLKTVVVLGIRIEKKNLFNRIIWNAFKIC